MWIGADPGGKRCFGVARLGLEGDFRTVCVSCADDALKQFRSNVRGVGIDSPLWWSSAEGSRRYADKWLRETHKIHPGTVQSANSLKGAALIQGYMLIARLREQPRFRALPVTEAHPKALLRALGSPPWGEIAKMFGLKGEDLSKDEREHERDAVLAAVAAREGFSGRWSIDLGTRRSDSEQDPARLWFGPIHYWWPDKETISRLGNKA